MQAKAPQLLELAGCGALTAAKIIAETAGVERFSSDAKLARLAGVAPIPASSGKNNRHRLDRGGNRQLNAAIHRMAVTRARCDPETQNYITRKKTEGKTQRDAIRCLKRHLARRIWHLLQPPTPSEISLQSLDIGAAREAARRSTGETAPGTTRRVPRADWLLLQCPSLGGHAFGRALRGAPRGRARVAVIGVAEDGVEGGGDSLRATRVARDPVRRVWGR